MAGFFGLFGGKSKSIESENNGQSSRGSAFYLNADDAKSFGNIEFMRQATTTRRTFPKTLNSAGGELVQQVSSTEKTKLNGFVAKDATANGNGSKPATQSNQAQVERRSVDSSMDMFRKMAKDMKK
jgi:hypothetical protein